jgi:hypothetical protein
MVWKMLNLNNVEREFLEKDSMTEVHYFGHNLTSAEAMSMNFCERKLY